MCHLSMRSAYTSVYEVLCLGALCIWVGSIIPSLFCITGEMDNETLSTVAMPPDVCTITIDPIDVLFSSN